MTSFAPPHGAHVVRGKGAPTDQTVAHEGLLKPAKPFASPTAAVILVCFLTLLFTAIDFWVPGEIDVAVLYGLSVGACAWSLSRRFLWAVTGVCVALTWAGQAFGPEPITGDAALGLLWIGRVIVAVGLVVLASFIHQWIRRSERLAAAQVLLRELNESLELLVAQRTSALATSEGRLQRAEEGLRQAQKMEAIGQLTGGISHDFNNFLTAIIGNLEMIADGPDDAARGRRLARSALTSAENAARLVQHLLAFSRRQELAPQSVRAEEMVKSALPLWHRALGETIALEMDIPGDVWPCRADPAQLEAAILNLVINARDAMPNGGRLTIRARNMTVAAGVVTDLSAGDYLLLSVTDTGIGIPIEIQHKVCEPFFTTKDVGKGSGLGLSMVYGFVRQSGGTLLIASAPGAGTTMALHLPRALPEGIPGEAGEERARDGDVARATTVLIVEDEEQVRRVAAEALESAGHKVLLAGNGREALALLQEVGRVDLVVSDIIMPGGMNGAELAQRIEQSSYASPVLLTTGYFSKPGAPLVDEGRFEILRKPFGPTELCTRVRKLIAAREPPQAAPFTG